MPSIGQKIKEKNEQGTVISVDLLSQKYKVDFNGDIREYSKNE